MVTFTKDPSATLDYTFDWSKNLPTEDTITAAVVTVPVGITKVNSAVTTDGRAVVVWLSGGTAGNTYSVNCRITTASTPPRVNEATFGVLIVDR
jgi:hypothetical protein